MREFDREVSGACLDLKNLKATRLFWFSILGCFKRERWEMGWIWGLESFSLVVVAGVCETRRRYRRSGSHSQTRGSVG